jgi:tRNA A37 methylthiotransferase MiaB
MLHGTDWSALGWPFLVIICCDSVTGGGRQKSHKRAREARRKENVSSFIIAVGGCVGFFMATQLFGT